MPTDQTAEWMCCCTPPCDGGPEVTCSLTKSYSGDWLFCYDITNADVAQLVIFLNEGGMLYDEFIPLVEGAASGCITIPQEWLILLNWRFYSGFTAAVVAKNDCGIVTCDRVGECPEYDPPVVPYPDDGGCWVFDFPDCGIVLAKDYQDPSTVPLRAVRNQVITVSGYSGILAALNGTYVVDCHYFVVEYDTTCSTGPSPECPNGTVFRRVRMELKPVGAEEVLEVKVTDSIANDFSIQPCFVTAQWRWRLEKTNFLWITNDCAKVTSGVLTEYGCEYDYDYNVGFRENSLINFWGGDLRSIEDFSGPTGGVYQCGFGFPRSYCCPDHPMDGTVAVELE